MLLNGEISRTQRKHTIGCVCDTEEEKSAVELGVTIQ
jgi:hypothetical protein